MVEDFPKSRISLSYSDGSYTYKHPHSVGRQKRQIMLNSNNSSALLNTTIGNTTNLLNATTAYNTTTAAPRVYRTTIPPLSRLPLQFSIHGLLLLFFNGCLEIALLISSAQSLLHRLIFSGLT